jgi:hypothetical protein
MPRNFANNGLVTCSTGGLAALDGGPVTMACIIKLTDSVNGAILYAGTSTSSVSFAMEIFSNQYSFTTSAGGQNCVGGINSDNWHMACISKASGTATPRGHKYVYDTDTWTHSNAAGTLADGASTPGSGGVIQLGRYATTEYINADIAIIGCWDRVLSDAEAELLPFSLQSWYHTGPVGLWVLDQADTAVKVLDVTGNGANESALTVTSVSTVSLPVFSYGFGDTVAAGHSAGSAVKDADAAVSIAATITAAAASAKPVDATLTGTATVAAAAASTKPVDAALTATATATPAAATTKPVTATATTTATITAGAASTKPVDAALTATATITASASVGAAPVSIAAAPAFAATIAAAAAAAKPVQATLAAVATITASASIAGQGLAGRIHGPESAPPGAIVYHADSLAGSIG